MGPQALTARGRETFQVARAVVGPWVEVPEGGTIGEALAAGRIPAICTAPPLTAASAVEAEALVVAQAGAAIECPTVAALAAEDLPDRGLAPVLAAAPLTFAVDLQGLIGTILAAATDHLGQEDSRPTEEVSGDPAPGLALAWAWALAWVALLEDLE